MNGEAINDLHESEPRWFAVKTRSKSEKFVKRMLEKKAVSTYLPLQKFLRKYGRVKRTVEMPLINCYIFVHIVKEQYLRVLETENVAGFVRFNRDLVAIPEQEIDIIRRVTLEEGLDIEAIPGHFEKGDRVEISAGGLMGLKGEIVKKEGKRKFQIVLTQMGMSLLITVDAAFLEKSPLK